jgi:hypothetical protein
VTAVGKGKQSAVIDNVERVPHYGDVVEDFDPMPLVIVTNALDDKPYVGEKLWVALLLFPRRALE